MHSTAYNVFVVSESLQNYTGEIKTAHQIPLQFARSAAGSGGRVSGIFSEQIEVVDHFVLFPQHLKTPQP